jgi:hypothetical protein
MPRRLVLLVGLLFALPARANVAHLVTIGRARPLSPPAITAPPAEGLVTAASVSISTSHPEAVAGRIVEFERASDPAFSDAVVVATATTDSAGNATNPAVPMP